MTRSPQESGYDFEERWAKFFGVEPTRGSGNQWTAKLDVGDISFLWSCKWTGAESFRITREMMREVQNAITGPGGIGGDVIPGIATDLDGEIFVTLRGEDFLRIIQSDNFKYVVPSMGEQKRLRARVPALLRDDDAS